MNPADIHVKMGVNLVPTPHLITEPSMFRRTLLAALVVAASHALAGPLDPPPGPIQSTLKTLVDVEPRTAVSQENTPGDSDATYVISQPGSYYLSGDVNTKSGQSGIKIASFDGVTLDLNGFTIRGDNGSEYGVLIQGNDITVRNGRMQGFKGGISPGAGQLTAEDLDITLNASQFYDGISSSQFLRVARCSIAFAGGYGIAAQTAALVTDCHIIGSNLPSSGGIVVGSGLIDACTIYDVRNQGILLNSGTVRGASVSGSFTGSGVRVVFSGTIESCSVSMQGGTGTGFLIGEGTISGCTAANGFTGFILGSDSSVQNCVATGMSSRGFQLSGGGSATDCSATSIAGVAFESSGRSSLNNCSVRSADTGFSLGNDSTATNCSAKFITLDAFNITSRATLTGCTASNSRNGFVATDAVTFTDCRADGNSQRGFVANDRSVFTNCSAANNATGGFVARDGTLFNRCVASDNTLDGFNARFGSRWEACVSRSNTGDGIETSSGGNILNCLLDTNGLGASIAANIRVTGDSARIDGNTLVGADFGLVVSAAGNTIVRNNARNNGTNYSIVGGNDTGPIGTAATSTSPWANLQN
jgi:hypothetical protein